MKIPFLAGLPIVIVAAAGFLLRPSAAVSAPAAQPDARQPFAVIELFTSEGCSSCPPADKLLAKLLEDARKDGTRVFPIALHVDYWNRLGWSDRLSDARFSERQRRYAAAFANESVYTPQMIVNGQVEFVGSNARRASDAITAALKVTPAAGLTLAVKKTSGQELSVEFQLSPASGQKLAGDLNVFLVERHTETKVERGENSGRLLSHTNVARVWSQLAVDNQNAAGSLKLTMPKDVDPANAAIIAFVQATDTWTVLAAEQCPVPAE